jgi:hypothetical protein
MAMNRSIYAGSIAAVMLGVVVAAAGLSAQPAGVTFKGTATVKSPAKSASVPITIRIDRFLSDADREKVVALVKKNDGSATQKLLHDMPDIGYISLGEKRTPIKYAYSRSTGDGRLVTVVTAQPILFLGGGAPDAKPKAGFNLALALLVLNAQDKGDGEIALAVKLKTDNAGAIVTDEYGTEVVRLAQIAKVE